MEMTATRRAAHEEAVEEGGCLGAQLKIAIRVFVVGNVPPPLLLYTWQMYRYRCVYVTRYNTYTTR
jgi:hypothetical protein